MIYPLLDLLSVLLPPAGTPPDTRGTAPPRHASPPPPPDSASAPPGPLERAATIISYLLGWKIHISYSIFFLPALQTKKRWHPLTSAASLAAMTSHTEACSSSQSQPPVTTASYSSNLERRICWAPRVYSSHKHLWNVFLWSTFNASVYVITCLHIFFVRLHDRHLVERTLLYSVQIEMHWLNEIV